MPEIRKRALALKESSCSSITLFGSESRLSEKVQVASPFFHELYVCFFVSLYLCIILDPQSVNSSSDITSTSCHL